MFNGYEFAAYLSHEGVRHKKITPLWPRANAICERFMRNLNRVLRNSEAESTNWRTELQNFLKSYRATPHYSTKEAPSKLLFKTASSTSRLPNLRIENKPQKELSEKVKENDAAAKAKMKTSVDKKLRVKETEFNVGDKVLVKQDKKNKSTPKFDPNPYTIKQVKNSMIVAENEKHQITRNSSFFRRFYSNEKPKA
jgi:hypothetical protein